MPVVAVKKPPPPKLISRPGRKFPSAPQAKRAVTTGGGPMLKPTGAITGTPNKKPPTAHLPGAKSPMRIIRGPKMARRVGVPIVNRKKGNNQQVQNMLANARKNLAEAGDKTKTKEGKHGRTITRKEGKTIIKGKNKSWVVTQRGIVARNKAKDSITRTRYAGPEGNPQAKTRKIRITGGSTKTKADDTRLVKVKSAHKARLTYTKGEGPTTTVSRTAGRPRKLRVAITGPGGKTKTKVIGPKETQITNRAGKTRTVKTRSISQKRRENVTPRIGEKGWRQGNTKRRKDEKKGGDNESPRKRTKHKKRGPNKDIQNIRRGNWKQLKKFRKLRRKTGPRYNQSLTRGQLRSVASRRLA